jgi:uncharacterized coiled-coil protein SlyX
MSVEERLTDLEIRYAYQQKLCAALDDVVREFAGRVQVLERKLLALEAGRDGDGLPAGSHDKPPHY